MKAGNKIAIAVAAIGAWLLAKKKGAISGIGAADRDAVREILLWFENTEELYRKFTVPIANTLVKKMRKGITPDLDILANSSIVDNAVRETLRNYARSFGTFPVTTETRKEMKKEIANSILIYAQDEYDYEVNNE